VDRASATPDAGSVVPLALSLVLVGGVLQLLSRFLVFESSYAVTAAEAGQRTLPWLLAVGLPLVAASVLLIVLSGERRALASSAGLAGGAGLAQLDQSFATAAYWATPDSNELPGPGWWIALLGAVALLAAVVVVLRSPGFRARPVLRRDWRAVVATVVVLGALGVRLDAFAEAWPWLSVNEPPILLALACLPLTLLALGSAQRLTGLVAVTILGVWVCLAHVYAVVDQSFPVDQRAAVLAIATALVSVAACLLAQLGAPASRS
jgi:hypothetical protein